MATDEPLKQKTTIPTIIWRGAMTIIGVVGLGLVSWLTLASDARNDQRYLKLESYRVDRERDKEIRDLVTGTINQRLEAQDKKLDEIAGDVKTLLRESRK